MLGDAGKQGMVLPTGLGIGFCNREGELQWVICVC